MLIRRLHIEQMLARERAQMAVDQAARDLVSGVGAHHEEGEAGGKRESTDAARRARLARAASQELLG